MVVEKRDLSMEANVLAIALWYRIAAVLGLLLGGGAVLFAFDRLAPERQGGARIATAVGMAGCVFFYGMGHYLARYSNAARNVARLVTFLTILGNFFAIIRPGGAIDRGHYAMAVLNAISIVWLVAVQWALFNARTAQICTEEYRTLVHANPDDKPPVFRSPYFTTPFALIALSALIAGASWYLRR
ncbi:MAG: hypothetical protein HY897_15030 [Deltaproteobacteria bacterium]|nr:hypothetical protein [Deltaproteobacteria bacterium]